MQKRSRENKEKEKKIIDKFKLCDMNIEPNAQLVFRDQFIAHPSAKWRKERERRRHKTGKQRSMSLKKTRIISF